MKRIVLFLLLALLTAACERLGGLPQAAASPNAAPRLCAAADLQGSSSSNGAGGAIQIGVTLINVSKSPCILVGPPQITLKSGSAALAVQVVQAAAALTPPAPAGLSIAPGNGAIAILLWHNYCGTTLSGVTIHFTITTDQGLDVQAGAEALPHCEVPGEPSTLTVQQYSYPP
jgi:hypothetical protein